MNDITMTYLETIKKTSHMSMGFEDWLLLLLPPLIVAFIAFIYERELLAFVLGFIASGVLWLFILVGISIALANDTTYDIYVSQPMTVTQANESKDTADMVYEVERDGKTYTITSIKGMDKLKTGDRFYLKAKIKDGKYRESSYPLTDIKDDTKVIKLETKEVDK